MIHVTKFIVTQNYIPKIINIFWDNFYLILFLSHFYIFLFKSSLPGRGNVLLVGDLGRWPMRVFCMKHVPYNTGTLVLINSELLRVSLFLSGYKLSFSQRRSTFFSFTGKARKWKLNLVNFTLSLFCRSDL